MERVSVDDPDRRMGPAADKRALSEPLGTTDIAVTHYELAPGDTLGFGYHRHPEQEEVFYVVEGTATFETEDGDVDVAAGEAVRFAPGEWQLGRNDGSERVVALAVGAPRDTGETEMLRECDECGGRTENIVERSSTGENTAETADSREALVTRCTDCGAETGRFT
jgi:mannose-6-phosphate isomerase-like protein (cupin superfamily)